MNYLKITNQGLVEAEDLFLIGSSTKRNDNTKIGMFGSGWKFALAWFIRNEVEIKVFSGTKEINIDVEVVLHRNTPVKVLTIEGKRTSITTEMGMKWTGWMALREIISNAIDEGEETVNTIFNPVELLGEEEGKTTIWIEMNNELINIMRNYSKYFSFETKEDWISSEGHKFYLKKEETPMNVYRKGIRCLDSSRRTLVDINFNSLNINESRLTSEREVDTKVQNIFNSNDEIPIRILVALIKQSYKDLLYQGYNANIRGHCVKLIDSGYVLTTGFIAAFTGELDDFDKDLVLFIPGKWFVGLSKAGLVENPFDSKYENAPLGFIKTDKVDIYKIKALLQKYNLDIINIETGVWESGSRVSYYDGTIYLQDPEEGEEINYIDYATKVVYNLPSRIWKDLFRV